MALLAIADVAAGASAALLLGALVDRWSAPHDDRHRPRTRGMLFTVPLMAAMDRLTIGWLVVVVAVNGALTVAFELAQSAWIARSTTQEHLTQRNSALAAGGAITEAASFGITGWLFQWLGAIVVMVTDALTYLVSALLLTSQRAAALRGIAAGEASGRVRAFAAEVQAGLRATLVDPVLRGLAAVATLVALAASFASTTYMIYVSRDVAFSTGTLGLLFGLGGIGSLVGSWLTARMATRIDARIWLIGSLALWALGSMAAPMATTAGLIGIVLIAAQQLVGDAGGMAYIIASRTCARPTPHPPSGPRRCQRPHAGL
jgi:MFS family permease